jgi:hypothetical protein
LPISCESHGRFVKGSRGGGRRHHGSQAIFTIGRPTGARKLTWAGTLLGATRARRPTGHRSGHHLGDGLILGGMSCVGYLEERSSDGSSEYLRMSRDSGSIGKTTRTTEPSPGVVSILSSPP